MKKVIKFTKKHFIEALLYSLHSKQKEALAQIDRLLKVKKKDEKILYTKALILWELGTEEEVLDFIYDAKELAPNSTLLLKLEKSIINIQNLLPYGDCILD